MTPSGSHLHGPSPKTSPEALAGRATDRPALLGNRKAQLVTGWAFRLPDNASICPDPKRRLGAGTVQRMTMDRTTRAPPVVRPPQI